MSVQKIGVASARIMEELEEAYDLEGGDAIGEVLMVVEVRREHATNVVVGCTDNRRWAQLGLLTSATLAVGEA